MSNETDRRITLEFLNECLKYSNGYLFWKERPSSHFATPWRHKVFNKTMPGKIAGTLISGYLLINFKVKRIGVHRAIFLMHYGFLPPEVDHINGDPLDNRVENLRAATHAQNAKNMKTSSANTSGIKGVYWHKSTSKWMAQIREEGKYKTLGFFVNKDEAAMARRAAEIRVYGEFANER